MSNKGLVFAVVLLIIISVGYLFWQQYRTKIIQKEENICQRNYGILKNLGSDKGCEINGRWINLDYLEGCHTNYDINYTCYKEQSEKLKAKYNNATFWSIEGDLGCDMSKEVCYE